MMFATIYAVLTVIAVPTLIGAVIARLVSWRSPMTADDWIDAPFLGIAAIIVPLQNGFYFGVPIRYTAMPLLIVYAVAAAVLIARRRLGRARDFPVAPFAVGLGVYVIQGVGLFTVGIDRYMGRAWGDQINYVALSEFIWRLPAQAASWPDLPFFALVARTYTRLRLGQSVLHAFLARVALADPKTAFEPIILLSAFLMALAVYTVVRAAAVPARWSLLVAAVASIVPALASIQLECFLSHALSLPLLMYIIALCERTARTGRGADFIKLALVLSALASTYLEFLPLGVACVLVLFAAGLWRPAPRWSWFVKSALVLASPFLLNVTHGAVALFSFIGRPVLGSIFPWALSVEGIERLWIGDLAYIDSVRESAVVRAFAWAVTGLGYCGLAANLLSTLFSRQSRESADSGSRVSRVVLAVALCGIASAPLTIVARDLQHPYQFYKLMLSVTPLLVIGMAVLARMALTRWNGHALVTAAVTIAAVAIAAPALWATMAMGLDSTHWPPSAPSQARQTTQLTLQAAFPEAQAFLGRQRDRQIVVCASDNSWSGGYLNAWLGYFARDNRVWALNPRVNDQNLRVIAGERYLESFPRSLVPGTLVVTTEAGALWASGAVGSTVWQAGQFQVSERTTRPLVLMCHVGIQSNGGHVDRADMTIPPDEPDLVVLSSHTGEASLVMRPDPATRPLMPGLALIIDGTAAVPQAGADDEWRFTFPLRSGLSRLHFTSRESGPSGRPTASVLRATGVRLLLSDVHTMTPAP
jgi:hypothetical protein